jgi:hypothetical protein
LIPSLPVMWLGMLAVALVNLVLAIRRGQMRRPLSSMLYDWLGSAAAMSIGLVVEQLYSRTLISLGLHNFIIAMLCLATVRLADAR